MSAASRRCLVVLATTLSLAAPAWAIDITACDQEVPAGEVGVLTTDLDCGPNTVPGSYAVELERSATLDLQGHTIVGSQWAVYCPDRGGKCTVTSTTAAPGTIRGAEAGIWGPGRKNVISNVHFEDNGYAIAGNRRTMLTDVSFADNGFVVSATSLRATNVTVTGSCTLGYCISLNRTGRIEGLVTATSGSSPVIQAARSVNVRNASMTGSSEQFGIFAGTRIRIRDSILSGHGFDIGSRRLRIENVSCGRSVRFGRDGFQVGGWGVCAND